MKKIFTFLALTISLYSHELKLYVEDNKNNTITVAGEFDTGEDAAGAMVRLESLINGSVLFQKRLPIESEIVVDIPKEPYKVVLDGGENHTLEKDGIAPLEGFDLNLTSKIKQTSSTKKVNSNEWDSLTIIFFSICASLFALTIYFSNKNTNKILRYLKEN